MSGTAVATSRGTTLNTGFGQPDYSWDRTYSFPIGESQGFPTFECPLLAFSRSSPNFIVFTGGVPSENRTLRMDLSVTIDPYTSPTSVIAPCTNGYRVKGDGAPVGGGGLDIQFYIRGNSITSTDEFAAISAQVSQSNHPDGVDPTASPPIAPFWKMCRSLRPVASDPPTTQWVSTVTWGVTSISPKFRTNGCLYGASGSTSARYEWRFVGSGSLQIEGFYEWSLTFDLESNLGLCCGSDSPDEVAHARDVAMFQAMHSGLRGDHEEIAQRMRFGRACRGCG